MRVGATEETAETPDNSEHFEIPATAAEEAPVDPTTILATLAEDMAKEADESTLDLVVPMREDFMMHFNPRIDYDSLRLWIKKAREQGKKSKDEEPHMLRLSFAVLSNTNVGISYKGIEVPAPDGKPLTINHPAFLSYVKAKLGNSVPAAIRKFYGRDGHIIMTMNRVIEAAGFGDIDLEGGADGSPLDY